MRNIKYFIIGLSLIIIVVFFYITLKNFKSENSIREFSVKLTDTIDPEIVLINIEDGNRSFIANLLLKINSCNPRVIGIDAFFVEEKDPIQDSLLLKAFEVVENDIIAYYFDSTGTIVKSAFKFVSTVTGEGYVGTEEYKGLLSFFRPILAVGNKNYEHFTLQVINRYKGNNKLNFKADESIPIQYTRTLNQFIHFDGSELTAKNCEDLKNKIVLVGYLGPKKQDKHFTPLRYLGRYDADEPDTYGLVINANIIRTILDYENK